MTRTTAREIAVQLIYALDVSGLRPETLLEGFFDKEHFLTLDGEDRLYSTRPDKKQLVYVTELVTKTAANLPQIDAYIEKYSRGWKNERISRTAMACLRCALCEIEYMAEVTPQVAINEAVELSKGYDEPETVAFINGILGEFMRREKGADAPAPVGEAVGCAGDPAEAERGE